MDNLAELTDEQLAEEARSRKNKKRIDSLSGRYWDAYVVARTITGFGSTIKGIGFVIGAILALGGFLVASKNGPSDPMSIIGMLVIGMGIFCIALFFVIGVIVSSQGQILKASLDGAVNTSPFIGDEHRAKIMSLD